MRPFFPLKSTLLGIALLTAGTAGAQMSGGSVFLKGHYSEAGIKSNGAFGAPSQPTGYHGNVGTSLGFVADPDMDGWSVGSPAYYGDFFMPGSPFEGWAIQSGGVNGTAYGTNPGTGFTGVLTGSNISYTTSGTHVTGTWQGMFDSIQVTQVISLDTNLLYFTVNVTYTNLSTAAKDNIYYIRTMDPDNDEMQSGGSFATINMIEHQSTDTTVVSARAMMHPSAYIALGTTDSNSTAAIYTAWPLATTVDLGTLYDGTYSGSTSYFAAGDSAYADIAIGLVFKVAHLSPLDSASDSVGYRTTSTGRLRPANAYTFNYFYAFSPAARDSAISQLRYVPASSTTTAINNVNTVANINVFPNPAKNTVSVSGLNAGDHVSMYDMMGKCTEFNQPVGSGINTFSLNGLSAGNYIMMIKDSDGNVRSRVRVQKQ